MILPRLRSALWLSWTMVAALLPAQSTPPPASKPGIAPSAHQSIIMADSAFKAGSAAYAKGDLKSAHAAFARVVRLTPRVGAGHSAYGAILLEEGNLRAAIEELTRARQLDPNDGRASINLGLAYFRMRDFPAAVTAFRSLPQPAAGAPALLTPEETVSFAGALSATGDAAGAQERVRSALLLDPGSAILHDALGTLLAQSQQNDEASTEFHQAVTLNPTLALAHFHIGSLATLTNHTSEAVQELTRASKLDPANVDFAVALGRALDADGHIAEAITLLRQLVSLHPDSLDATYALGLALQSNGQPRDALPLFAAVTAARPQDGSALTNHALALVQTGEAKQAIPLYEQALKTGDSSTLREDLGVAYLQLSQLDRAIEEFRKGLALDPGNPHLHYDLALGLKLKDKTDEAVAEFLEAERIDPSLPDPPYTLGVLYMQLGRFAESKTELEKALGLRSENGEAWALLGNVDKQLNDIPKAKSALEQASKLLPEQPGPHISLAAILSQQGDTAGAAAQRKIAADLSRVAYARQRASFSLESGRALLKKADLTGAAAQLGAAIAADPTLPEPHLLLADVLAQQHRPADAALERKKAQELAAQTTLNPPARNP